MRFCLFLWGLVWFRVTDRMAKDKRRNRNKKREKRECGVEPTAASETLSLSSSWPINSPLSSQYTDQNIVRTSQMEEALNINGTTNWPQDLSVILMFAESCNHFNLYLQQRFSFWLNRTSHFSWGSYRTALTPIRCWFMKLSNKIAN